jgi:hypothetical protein
MLGAHDASARWGLVIEQFLRNAQVPTTYRVRVSQYEGKVRVRVMVGRVEVRVRAWVRVKS